jgi:hypothetical protein
MMRGRVLFWLFSTFLIVLTIISALGGGIRFRENFMDELFDTINVLSNQDSSDLVNDDMLRHTIVHSEQVQEEQQGIMSPAPAPVVHDHSSPQPLDGSSVSFIEAFDGDSFASFD